MTPEEQAALSYSSAPANPMATDVANLQSDPNFANPIANAPVPQPSGDAPSGVPPLGANFAPPVTPQASPTPAPATSGVPPVDAIPVLPKGVTPEHVRAAASPTPAQPSQMQTDADAARAADAKQLETAKTANEDEADSLEAQAEVKKRQAADLQVQQRIQAMDREESDQRIATAFRDFKEHKRTSFFADKTVLQDVAMGLGAILGSVSFSENHTNEALNTIDRAIHRHMEQQEADRADLFKGIQIAQQQGQSLRADQIHELSNLRLDQALTLEGVIDQGKAMASRSKNKAGIAAMESNNARLALERDKMLDDVRRLDGAQKETARHNRAEEGIQREHVAAIRENAGGGSGEEKIAKLASKLYDEKQAKKDVHNEAEARDLVDLLKRDPTALASGLAMERLVSVFSGGGKASTTALKMVDAHAGSWADISQSKLQEAFSGNQGEGKRKKLIHLAEEEYADKANARKRSVDAANAGLAGLERRFPDAVKNYKAGLFGSEPSIAVPPSGSKQGKLSNGTIAYKYPDGTVHDANGVLIK